MMNKRGQAAFPWYISLIAFAVILAISIFVMSKSTDLSAIYNTGMSGGSEGFGTAWGNEGFVFMDYIVGQIPKGLIDFIEKGRLGTVREGSALIGASIITLALWVLIFITFADILSVFGFFNKGVAWLAAALLAVIGANLGVLKLVSVYALAVTSIIGTTSVIVSLLYIFVLFVLFNFGTTGVRRMLIMRRAEDSAMRAVAGGKKAASGVEVLKEIAKKAEKGE